MVIATSHETLNVALSQYDVPVVIQEWVSLAGLFKVYILGEKFTVSKQKKIRLDKDILSFNSAKMQEIVEDDTVVDINEEVVKRINEELRKATGLGMISYDIGIDEKTGDYVLIDLNYFPGYYTMPDFKHHMDEYIIESFNRFKNSS